MMVFYEVSSDKVTVYGVSSDKMVFYEVSRHLSEVPAKCEHDTTASSQSDSQENDTRRCHFQNGSRLGRFFLWWDVILHDDNEVKRKSFSCKFLSWKWCKYVCSCLVLSLKRSYRFQDADNEGVILYILEGSIMQIFFLFIKEVILESGYLGEVVTSDGCLSWRGGYLGGWLF